MISKIVTNRQVGQFVFDHKPEILIEGGYVFWLMRQSQDIIVSWDYGNVFSCMMYFPVTSEDYQKLLTIASGWNSAHKDWRLVERLALFRLEQIEQALDGSQRLAVLAG